MIWQQRGFLAAKAQKRFQTGDASPCNPIRYSKITGDYHELLIWWVILLSFRPSLARSPLPWASIYASVIIVETGFTNRERTPYMISLVTPFLREASNRNAKIVAGLGMLVYQGAIGFKLWTGLDAPVEVMHKALSKAFNRE